MIDSNRSLADRSVIDLDRTVLRLAQLIDRQSEYLGMATPDDVLDVLRQHAAAGLSDGANGQPTVREVVRRQLS